MTTTTQPTRRSITAENHEWWLMGLMDGQLSEAERSEAEALLAAHPEWRDELEELANPALRITPQAATLPGRDRLLKAVPLWPRRAVAAAAAAVVLAGGALLWPHGSEGAQVAMTHTEATVPATSADTAAEPSPNTAAVPSANTAAASAQPEESPNIIKESPAVAPVRHPQSPQSPRQAADEPQTAAPQPDPTPMQGSGLAEATPDAPVAPDEGTAPEPLLPPDAGTRGARTVAVVGVTVDDARLALTLWEQIYGERPSVAQEL